MAEETGRPRLGRGLAALIGDVGEEVSAVERARGMRRIPVAFLRPNPRNPRRHFDEVELNDLAASIQEKDIIQPIVVRTVAGEIDAYEIIAGERRWRAAQIAGLHDVPVHLVEVGDREALELAIIENIQRSDLNPIEEALGYQELLEQFGYTQDALAKVVGKSRPHITNTLRLLKLPQDVQDHVTGGKLSAGHARALLAYDDPVAMAGRVIEEGLNVRQLEALGHEPQPARRNAPEQKSAREKDIDTQELEKALSQATGMKVSITHQGQKGKVTISYRSLEQLDDICRKLQS